jgi:hypothetical protein
MSAARFAADLNGAFFVGDDCPAAVLTPTPKADAIAGATPAK